MTRSAIQMSALLLSAITPAASRESGETAIAVSRPAPPASASARSVQSARPGRAVRIAASVPPALIANCAMPSPPVTDVSTESAAPVSVSVRSSKVAACRSLPLEMSRDAGSRRAPRG